MKKQLLLILLVLCGLAGCGLMDSTGLTWVRQIGPEGGTVELEGATLTIPEGAVPEDTEFSIAIYEDAPEGHVGPAFEILPDGFQFSVPATLTIDVDTALLPEGIEADSLQLAFVQGDQWTTLKTTVESVDFNQPQAQGNITHLSVWGLYAAPPVTCKPQEEVCDEKDNDCDGEVDEGGVCDPPDPCEELDCNDLNPCTEDSCVAGKCEYAPIADCCTPSPEVCDGEDNDCDDHVDEDGVCDIGMCEPLDCDDQDPCTEDACVEGECVNTPNPACCIPVVESCNGLDDDCDGLTDESFPDFDGDLAANCVDKDDDDDGVPDVEDNCPLDTFIDRVDNDGDGMGDSCDPDDDNDGIPDEYDNCQFVANTSQVNLDNDPLGDACDWDMDADGDANEDDCSPADPDQNAGAMENCDGIDNNCDGNVDEGYGDMDEDGVADCIDMVDDMDDVDEPDDNCPLVNNPGQEDADGDGMGDACDSDDDNDGDPDGSDCAPLDSSVYHGALELCNGVDNDCSGWSDDGEASEICDDQNLCTDDSCDQEAGLCTFEASDCDDADPCTVDVCEPEFGCIHSEIPECE
jgi:hypothetical protein